MRAGRIYLPGRGHAPVRLPRKRTCARRGHRLGAARRCSRSRCGRAGELIDCGAPLVGTLARLRAGRGGRVRGRRPGGAGRDRGGGLRRAAGRPRGRARRRTLAELALACARGGDAVTTIAVPDQAMHRRVPALRDRSPGSRRRTSPTGSRLLPGDKRRGAVGGLRVRPPDRRHRRRRPARRGQDRRARPGRSRVGRALAGAAARPPEACAGDQVAARALADAARRFPIPLAPSAS